MPDIPILAGVAFAWVFAIFLFVRNDAVLFFDGLPFETVGRPRAVPTGIALIATAILLIAAS